MSYWLETHLQETAHLAQVLVRDDVLPFHAYKEGQSLLEFLRTAFKVRFAELGLNKSTLNVTLRIADESPNDIEGVYLTVNLQPVYLDLGGFVKKLDALDPRLAAALIDHLRGAAEKIVPIFEGRCCFETVEWLIWGGDEEELLERARDELAQARGVLRHELSADDVTAFADSHFLTSTHLNERLELRFQEPEPISLERLRKTFAQHRCDKLVELCDVVAELSRLEPPISDSDIFYERGDFNPYGLILGLPKGESDDFVGEIFEEFEQYVWSGGDWAPSYVFEVNLRDDKSLDLLARSLEVVLQSLALVTKMVRLLEEETR